MTDGVAHNPNIRAVPVPLADTQSLTHVVYQLRESVESLGGIRGVGLDRAVTLRDLVTLGVVSEATIRERLRGT